MDIEAEIAGYTIQLSNTALTEPPLANMLSLIDLTALSGEESALSIENLCLKAHSTLGNVAAVCVYPKFISLVKKYLSTDSIKIASVANFPTGNQAISSVLEEIHIAISSGANEIDVVFPYTAYINGQEKDALQFIAKCKHLCDKHHVLMKVILEISEFNQIMSIYHLSKQLIEAGADFIKTSTGKSRQGATLEGASAMLLAIRDSLCQTTGFKVSGGIRTVKEAMAYINLASRIMGQDWLLPNHFRIGASSLIDSIKAT